MFKDDQSDKTLDDKPTETISLEDRLKGIVNEEGKQKYDNVDKALDALKNSQNFIPTLEKDNKSLRMELETLKGELSKRGDVESVVNKLLQKEEDNKPVVETGQPPAPTIDEGSIAELVSSLLEKREFNSRKETNVSKVESAFVEKFGDQAATKFQELAKETNLTVKDLEELSAKSPDAVLRLIPDSPKAPQMSFSKVNTSALFGLEKEDKGLQASTKSVLAGATSRDLKNEMLRHKQAVYDKHKVET